MPALIPTRIQPNSFFLTIQNCQGRSFRCLLPVSGPLTPPPPLPQSISAPRFGCPNPPPPYPSPVPLPLPPTPTPPHLPYPDSELQSAPLVLVASGPLTPQAPLIRPRAYPPRSLVVWLLGLLPARPHPSPVPPPPHPPYPDQNSISFSRFKTVRAGCRPPTSHLRAYPPRSYQPDQSSGPLTPPPLPPLPLPPPDQHSTKFFFFTIQNCQGVSAPLVLVAWLLGLLL